MDKRIFMLLGAVIIIGGTIFLLRYYLNSNTSCNGLNLVFSSKDLKLGDSLKYADATTGAKEWSWNFGDGIGSSGAQSGSYKYLSEGKYTVKLVVNNKCMDSATISVSPEETTQFTKPDITIKAPLQAHVGEKVNFECVAPGATTWEWQFGENGTKVDAHVQNPSYTYYYPNKYTVMVKTDLSLTRGTYEITVLPKIATSPTVVSPGKQTGENKSIKLPPTIRGDLKTQLNNLATNGRFVGGQKEIDAFYKYMIIGPSTPVTWNIQDVKVEVIADVVNQFNLNPGVFEIKDIKYTTDKTGGYISSLNINAQRQ